MNYRSRHKSMNVNLTLDEHARACEIAARKGKFVSHYVTEGIRQMIQADEATLAPDAGDGEC